MSRIRNRIIAISGKYGTGKDTLTYAIMKKLTERNFQVEHIKFADPLKKSCALISGLPFEDAYTDEGKSKMISSLNMTMGRLQQVMGTILREHLHPNIWITPVIEFCKNNPNKYCIISDCRFPNEVKAIKELGGIVIRINRKRENINLNGRDPNHISETALDNFNNFDLVVENNSTIDEMIDSVLNYLF